jgi:hypothetical protein
MPDRLSIHAPTLVNTIGHAAGAIIFGILLYLLFNDWRRNPSGKPFLPSAAAALALLWNLGSMVGLATDPQSGFFADLIIAASFSVLSFLPAVLLHLSAAELKPLVVAGYVVSSVAAVLHFADLFTGAARYHYAAILLITIGFGLLTGVVLIWRGAAGRPHLAAAMGLFLFSISFAHFNSHLGAQHGGRAWSGEIALHHCGIPLALFVLLQDYRFLLLDTFIRFLVNACLAAGAVGLLVFFGTKFDPLREVTAEPFYAGLVFVGACVLLILFGWLRRRVQDFVTRALFLRANPEKAGLQIQELGVRGSDEEAFLAGAAKVIAGFIGCDRFEWGQASNAGAGWVEIALPVHFAQGDSRVLRLGARRGGRMFLSEDVSALERLLLEVSRQIDRLRAAEMQALMVKGELQALQAQINPHFLFNTLNTIYGSIPRDNSLARNLILNLSEILRYSLSRERSLIPLEEELRTVQAYLDIEQARLGPRLRIEINVDQRASKVEIPAFSIQPLVENAVKYGAAARAGSGYVKLTVGFEEDTIQIAVANSGGFPGTTPSKGNGLALNNVRRRLDICYGAAAQFRIEGDAKNTVVRFDVPARQLTAT